jgi:hypothetical protein
MRFEVTHKIITQCVQLGEPALTLAHLCRMNCSTQARHDKLLKRQHAAAMPLM